MSSNVTTGKPAAGAATTSGGSNTGGGALAAAVAAATPKAIVTATPTPTPAETQLDPPVQEDTGSPEFIAYRVSTIPPMKLARAPIERRWMEATRDRFANRCLPLLIANQAGWLVLNQVPFRATWGGGWDMGSMKVERIDGQPGDPPALSHFGEGVLTFNMPWIFRTPPGWNLWVRGPSNWPKYGIYALEGVVETDWSLATFTMNWFFTAQNTSITFEKDEPICMLVPQRRGDLEALRPIERDIAKTPEMHEAYTRWSASRTKFIEDIKRPGSEAAQKKWEKHYFQGLTIDGTEAPQHQTRLFLKEFDTLELQQQRQQQARKPAAALPPLNKPPANKPKPPTPKG